MTECARESVPVLLHTTCSAHVNRYCCCCNKSFEGSRQGGVEWPRLASVCVIGVTGEQLHHGIRARILRRMSVFCGECLRKRNMKCFARPKYLTSDPLSATNFSMRSNRHFLHSTPLIRRSYHEIEGGNKPLLTSHLPVFDLHSYTRLPADRLKMGILSGLKYRYHAPSIMITFARERDKLIENKYR